MSTPGARREQHLAANRREYGDEYASLRFVEPAAAAAAMARRAELLAELAAGAQLGCRGTKLDCRGLSPGCRLCGAGTWSCLFVNSRCNCRCFYCPAPQDELDVPTTQTVPFATAAPYAAYVERFGFAGVSISGGEPLLTLDRSLEYLAAVRDRSGERLHTWLYTNGTLMTPVVARRLRAAGLDEIRFDISACGYDLRGVAAAAGIVPIVTVEIPAIPEDAALLRARLPALIALGVAHLNLHQLRLTPHNLPRLRARGYTFLHGPRVTVMESELTALEVMAHVCAERLALPVNYCSFAYKSRYQAAASRQRYGTICRKPYEELTANGYIRRLRVRGPAALLRQQAAALAARAAAAPQAHGAAAGETPPAPDRGAPWELSPDGTELRLPLALATGLRWADCRLAVEYAAAHLVPRLSYLHPFTEVRLDSDTTLYVERRAAPVGLDLGPAEASAFVAALAAVAGADPAAAAPAAGEAAPALRPVAEYEFIEAGLPEYC